MVVTVAGSKKSSRRRRRRSRADGGPPVAPAAPLLRLRPSARLKWAVTMPETQTLEKGGANEKKEKGNKSGRSSRDTVSSGAPAPFAFLFSSRVQHRVAAWERREGRREGGAGVHLGARSLLDRPDRGADEVAHERAAREPAHARGAAAAEARAPLGGSAVAALPRRWPAALPGRGVHTGATGARVPVCGPLARGCARGCARAEAAPPARCPRATHL